MFDKLAYDVLAKFKRKKLLDSGTTVYMYSEKQIAERNRRKAKRLEKLRKNIKHLRSQVKRDLTAEDPEKALTALAVGLMDATAERVGSNASASGNLNEDGEPHFGVTTWTKKHISFGKGGATIKYVGKSGVKHTKKVSDAGLVKALRKAYACIEGDDCIFNLEKGSVGGEHVNAYLKSFGITAKDLRGFHANSFMKQHLKAVRAKGGKLPEDKKEREKKLKEEFKKALEKAAEDVGHEPSTLRSQYLIPGLEESYLKDGSVSEKMTKQAVFVKREPWEEAYPATNCVPPSEDRPIAYPTTWWNIDRHWDGSPVEEQEEPESPHKQASSYGYHGTNSKKLVRIQVHGLIPGAWSDFGDSYSDFDDGRHLFFTDQLEAVKSYGDVVLRFPWPSDAQPDQNKYGRYLPNQFVSKLAVPTSRLEVLNGEKWEPLGLLPSDSAQEFVSDFFRRHPQLRKYAGIKVMDKASGGSGTHGEARQHGNEIWLFPKFWKLDPKTRDFVFAHELGHYALSEYGLSKFIAQAETLGVDLWDTASLPFGQHNMDEAFADSFASFHLEPGELKRRYLSWEPLVLVVKGKAVMAAYSEDTLEIVAAGMALLLVQNYIVSNAFFDEKEIKKYLSLRRQFHGLFTQACADLADAFEEGKFGPGVKPAVQSLRAISQLNIKQEQQALRLMAKTFRGLRHLSYKDVDDPKILRIINIARKLNVPTEQYDRDYDYFLQSLIRVNVIPAPLRTLIRKVVKMPIPGKTIYEQASPGAWFEMPEDQKKTLREVAEKTKQEQDAIWEGPHKDDPEKRLELYRSTANRLQKIQNLAGVNLGIITKEDKEPLEPILLRESKLETDGPTEFIRLKLEQYIKTAGSYRYQRKEGDPLPREISKLLTLLKKAKTFPTIRRIVGEAVERDILGKGSKEDVENILNQVQKNRAIREGKPLVPLQFEPKTPEQFQIDHDTGEVEFIGDYSEDQKKEILGRVSRAISDLEGVYGKGFCGKHAKKLAFRFGGSSSFMAKAHYFTFDDRRVWQPRVTFGEDYEGVLAHELSHYLEDLLSHRIAVQEDPERVEELRRKGIEGAGGGMIFSNTGVPLSRLGKDATPYANHSRGQIGKVIPEFVEFIDTVLESPDYKRWEDKLGSAMDTALPGAIKNLTGMGPYDLPKDHPYYGIIEKAQYRSDLPPELLAEALRYFKELTGGDDRKMTYYQSGTEVWARMCEQYVYNKLIEAGISNPWLTWLSYDEDVYMDEKTFDEKLRPIMDRLFARLKGRSLLAHRVIARFLNHAPH